jgi:hypothetical protein
VDGILLGAMMRKLTYEQWKKLSDQCDATIEAENDFGRPIGEHYKLKNVIDELGLYYDGDKYLMTRFVQKILDQGYE